MKIGKGMWLLSSDIQTDRHSDEIPNACQNEDLGSLGQLVRTGKQYKNNSNTLNFLFSMEAFALFLITHIIRKDFHSRFKTATT